MSRRSVAFALLAAAAFAGRAQAAAKCQLMKVADLPVKMVGLVPTTPMTINGHEANLVTDSGAFFSIVSPAQAARYGLKLSPAPFGVSVGGVGGVERQLLIGRAAEVTLDKIPLKNVDFLVTGDESNAAGGYLGQNILGAVDTEFDLANGEIRLFKAEGCDKAMPAYWASDLPLSIVNVKPTTPSAPHLHGTVKVDGHVIHATFDTGAARSFLTLRAARRLGFRPDAAGVERQEAVGGFGPNVRESWIARFQTLEIGESGGEKIINPQLRVADFEFGGDDMLIGADFFLSHRIYVSKAQHRLYITYNGGPVFRLDRAGGDAPAPLSAPGAKEPPAAAGEALTSADALVRRAAASAARHDYNRAIADYSAAIKLEPKQAKHYVERASVQLQAKRPELAIADLDAALKLEPDEGAFMLLRGAAHLEAGQEAAAQTDFDAAIKAAPKDSAMALGVGKLWTDHADYARAIGAYDRWLAVNDSGERLAPALNGRCWARALSGHDLDKALADCDRAVALAPKSGEILDSRGLVKLRMGNNAGAVADYTAALRLRPNNAWSLYGRGVAEHRLGQQSRGNADINQAIVIEPDIQATARKVGVEDVAAK